MHVCFLKFQTMSTFKFPVIFQVMERDIGIFLYVFWGKIRSSSVPYVTVPLFFLELISSAPKLNNIKDKHQIHCKFNRICFTGLLNYWPWEYIIPIYTHTGL